MGLQIANPGEELQGTPTETPEGGVKVDRPTNETPEKNVEEVKEEEKETPSETSPEEKPAEETPEETPPVEVVPEVTPSVDTEQKAVTGLEAEKAKLLSDIVELRQSRRTLKQPSMVTQQPTTPTEPEINLDDIDPEVKDMVQKILKAGGYVNKNDVENLNRSNIEQDALVSFLETHPDLKPDNDPNDIKWDKFNSKIKLFRQPGASPRAFNEVLEDAYNLAFPKTSSAVGDLAPAKEKLEIASLGTGPTSSTETSPLTTEEMKKVESFRRGGFTEEETQDYIKKLRNKK